MRYIFLILLFVSAILRNAEAQNSLAYKWQPNSFYKFKAIQNDKIGIGGGGMMGMVSMGGDMNFKTESVFALAIDKLLPGGSATGKFYLVNFKVTDDKGNTLATIADLPKAALKANFTVDRKGNFTFTEVPILICRENSTLLVQTKIDKGEMAVSTEADGEKVTLFAEFNPKTGALKAGYTVATIAKPKPKAVTVKEDDETIDLVPTDFLDMLLLPDGAIAEGTVFKTKMYGTEVVEKVVDFQNQVANLNIVFKSAIDSKKMETDAIKMGGEDEEVKSEMDMGGMGMPGMEANGNPQLVNDMEGNINLTFDNKKGMIQKMWGTIDNKTNAMGMEISCRSTVEMTPMP